MSKIKVRVGQTWCNDYGCDEYVITRIARSTHHMGAMIAFAVKTGMQTEVGFVEVDDSGFCEYFASWRVKSEPAEERTSPETKRSHAPQPSDMDFFRRVSPGNCPCNIPRNACDFHR